MFISTQVISAYTFVTELSIIHSLNFSYKSGESHHTMHWAEHLPMPLYLNWAPFTEWTSHSVNSTLFDYLYVPELSTLYNLNFLFCKGEYCLQLKNLNLHEFLNGWTASAYQPDLHVISHACSIFLLFFAHNQIHTNLNSSTLTSWSSHGFSTCECECRQIL